MAAPYSLQFVRNGAEFLAEFEIPTREEFGAITNRKAPRMQRQLLAVDASYDRRLQRVMITLNTGAVVGFPLSVLPGLEHATPDDLRKIQVEGGGYGLHVVSLDADISIPRLLEDHLGSTLMKRAIARTQALRWPPETGQVAKRESSL